MITRRLLCFGLGSAILGSSIKAFLVKRKAEQEFRYDLSAITADTTTLRADVDYVIGDDFFASDQEKV
jgi:hypothetical protein